MFFRKFALCVAIGTAASFSQNASAVEPSWPTKPVRLVVPFAPGGGTDILARILSDRLQKIFGKPFVVDNRPGAGGNIGTENVARQPPDGYTLIVTTNTHTMNVAFYKKLPYEPIKDFTPISLIATSPLVVAVNANSGIDSMADLVSQAKAKPGDLSYGSTGVGTPQHVAPSMLETATKIKFIHVPYKGAGQVATALLSNEVTFAIAAANSILPHTKGGKLRILAVADAHRSKLLPDVPTVGESLQLSGYGVQLWYAVLAPAGIPQSLVTRLNMEINKAIRDPDLQTSRLTPSGLEGVGSSPEELSAVMQAEIPKYKKAAKDANITAE